MVTEATRDREGPHKPSLLPPSKGGAHCLCFVRCWVGVSEGGGAVSIYGWKYGGPSGPGEGQRVGKPPSSRQAEALPQDPMMGVRQVGGQDGGAPASPLLPASGSLLAPGMSRGPGASESWGAGGRPASERRWELAPPRGSDPRGSSQAAWKTREGVGGASPCLCSAPGCRWGTKGPPAG